MASERLSEAYLAVDHRKCAGSKYAPACGAFGLTYRLSQLATPLGYLSDPK